MKKILILAFLGLSLVLSAQTLRNSSNSSIGSISSDGTVRNSSNSTIGKIESDGTVRNSSNSSIGKAEGVKRSWAAAYFFFDYFKLSHLKLSYIYSLNRDYLNTSFLLYSGNFFH